MVVGVLAEKQWQPSAGTTTWAHSVRVASVAMDIVGKRRRRRPGQWLTVAWTMAES